MSESRDSSHPPHAYSLPGAPRGAVREALERLAVEDFVFAIHERALPSAPGAETGAGSLASAGGRDFLEQVLGLGFDAVQLGPSGVTDPANPSPYDGTLFSMSLLSVDLEALVGSTDFEGLLAAEELDDLLAGRPTGAERRVPVPWAWQVHERALALAAPRFLRHEGRERSELSSRFRAFVESEWSWLEGDALYQVLSGIHGSLDWRAWPDSLDRELWDPAPGRSEEARARRGKLRALYREMIDAWCFGQFVVHSQREQARAELAARGLALYGDVQVGMSLRDAWRHRALFVPGYSLGAPPSRTNPEGQPWGYPVFDPEKVYADGSAPARWPVEAPEAEPGPVLRFLDARFLRAFGGYDALRVDHPHGLVCPWVYRADAHDPHRAVREGARLLSSPDLEDHPVLAEWSIPSPEQIDLRRDRWAEGRVGQLSDEQVLRYGVLLERALLAAQASTGSRQRLVCEVLSTMPHPLQRVMSRHGMGRFRITHKASLTDPFDVYRAENARAEDWVMLTTQDTPPIWQVMSGWRRTGEIRERAAHVAARLAPSDRRRDALEREMLHDPQALATGMLAELLASEARHVLVFFTDLLGIEEPYNRPGVQDARNWTLRAPRLGVPGSPPPPLDIPRACALALRARGLASPELLDALRAPV